jgi:hypothetical protein
MNSTTIFSVQRESTWVTDADHFRTISFFKKKLNASLFLGGFFHYFFDMRNERVPVLFFLIIPDMQIDRVVEEEEFE